MYVGPKVQTEDVCKSHFSSNVELDSTVSNPICWVFNALGNLFD